MKKSSSSEACRRFRAHLSEVVAGGAAPETRSEAQAHRARCADCEQEYRLAERVEQGFGQLPQLFPLQEPAPQLDRMFGAARPVAPLTFDPTQPVELVLACQDFKDMLGDFVSEELPVGTLLDGVEHASSCRPCGDQLATMQTLQDSLRTLPDLEPPQRMFEQLMARIDAEEAEAGATALEPGKAKKTATARSKLLPVLG